ncbi:MAG: tetratricopeptide repeat protein [Proteobacteria bacterium]|nr:tetratricopeptide repeat protein [Pseudomonadota bacterium]MBU1585087.1 tetratricopeptide repeat protein [Pseudomonadota bacterium]MBU2629828.1 tetratricopeptide repeat protein [Pseudomonadota bacterium]
MKTKLKKNLIILILILLGCSSETNPNNFEDRFVKDIETACLSLLLNPSDLGAVRLRGDAYSELKQNEKAVKDYSILINSGKADYTLFLKRGKALHALGQYEDALSDFDNSIVLNPKNAWGYHRKADVLSALKKYNEALNNFSVAISLLPDDPGVYTCRGRVYRNQNQNEKALEAFNKAIEMDQNHFYSLYKRGLFYLNHDQYQQSIDDLKLLETIDPPYLSYQYRETAFVSMAYAHFKLKEYTKAISHFINMWKMRSCINSLDEKIKAAEKNR